MATKDNDTDPSTPSARRSGPPPPRVAPATDPGVGPQGQRRSPSGRPLGVVVPPATVRIPGPAGVPAEARVLAKKDSVELLLDGMSGPRPDRTRTTPQSGGEASAAYHAEHSVHPGHRPNDDAPKVLVDRPSTPRAIPVSTTQAAARRAPTVTGLSPAREGAGEPTFVTPPDLRRRVLLAAIAGLVVVFALFIGLAMLGSRQGTDIPVLAAPSVQAEPAGRVAVPAPSSAEQAAAEHAAVEPHEVVAPAPAPSPVEPPAVVETSPAAAKVAPPPAPAAPSRKHRPRTTAPSSPSSAAAPDLGEFKTKF
jgi:hypothetical protein